MRILVVGEGMVELSPDKGAWRLNYGGDTLNTAIHLSRFGHNVSFATALGTDRFSDDLARAWATEGLDTSSILRDPQRVVGLYAIHTDDRGERTFTYWRGESAARRMWSLPGSEWLAELARTADLLIFSLVSVAILSVDDRERLIDLCRAVRAGGGRVAFDGNYRPRLWHSVAEARIARDRAIAVSDFGLPTLEDEVQLGAPARAEEVARAWRDRGAAEVAVKLGEDGCWIDEAPVAPPVKLLPVDTSGAGDAFNAGYLHARLTGAPPRDAAILGHALAGWTLGRRGAIPARDHHAPYGSG